MMDGRLSRLAMPGLIRYFALMSFTATVENGAIKLPPDVHLPDGTKVTVVPSEVPAAEPVARKTFAERYAKYLGIREDGPEDLALNHDHYLYGAPKREG